jgi:hypothetical protein
MSTKTTVSAPSSTTSDNRPWWKPAPGPKINLSGVRYEPSPEALKDELARFDAADRRGAAGN